MEPLLASLILSLIFLLGYLIHQRSKKTEGQPNSKLSLSTDRVFDGLFAEQQAQEFEHWRQLEAQARAEQERQRLINRAAGGDKTALDEAAKGGDKEFYNRVLQALIGQSFTEQALSGQPGQTKADPELIGGIADYIVRSNGLRSNIGLAELVINQEASKTEVKAIARALYIAALSDDTVVYQRAVESALDSFKAGKPMKISARDFWAIVESSYWLIAPETRDSDSGFLLKQLIADVRRELAATTSATDLPGDRKAR